MRNLGKFESCRCWPRSPSGLSFPSNGQSAGDLSRQNPIEVTVELGKPGQHVFVPSQLKFETGKLYKLILRNPSEDPHYFTSDAFTQMIFTRKVQVTQQRDGKTRHARRIQGRDPRDRGLSGARGRMVVRAGRGRAREGLALRHRRQGRQEPRRARHGRRDRDRVSSAQLDSSTARLVARPRSDSP